MEDHVKHIRHTHTDREEQSWCGQTLTEFDWTFQGIDHAAYNAMSEGRLVVCPECVRKVVAVLSSEVD